MKQQDRYTKILVNSNKQGVNSQVYTFDRFIFLGYIVLLLLTFFYFSFLNGGLNANNNFYVKCIGKTHLYLDGNSISNCKNPLYHEYKYCNQLWVGACEQEYLPNGFTYGTPPPKFLSYFNYIFFIGIIFAFILNHLIYNIHFKFK